MEESTTTIYDVARVAGVSMATVSRVVNGNANVKEKTRQKSLMQLKNWTTVQMRLHVDWQANVQRQLGLFSQQSRRHILLKSLEALMILLQCTSIMSFSQIVMVMKKKNLKLLKVSFLSKLMVLFIWAAS